MKHCFLAAACLLLLFTSACKKNDEQPKPGGGPHPGTQFLLKSIEYASGIKAELSYNADSSLKQIAYTNGSAANWIYYKYQGKNMIETGYEASMYATFYTYTNGRISKADIQRKVSIPGTSYAMEYSYNGLGQVTTQKFYQTNETGTKLRGTSTYQYNAQGLVTQINSTDGTSKYTWKIETYSGEYGVSPWVFVHPDLSEFYTLYNYPVISSMKQLPVKFTKTVQHAGSAAKLERIDQQNYEITGKKITRLIAIADYPGQPELHFSDTAVFKY